MVEIKTTAADKKNLIFSLPEESKASRKECRSDNDRGGIASRFHTEGSGLKGITFSRDS
jgi:hypothetical protein